MSKSIKIIICIAATIIIALPICYQAYVNKLFIYDEGYYFIQAYELGEHGNFFIDFDPSVKLRNTKPYLFSALQTLLGITIGWNEWALRLPTIVSAVALIWMIFLFIQKTFKDTLWALCASTLLLVFPYYVYPHMAFTGDHDVPLIFFTTAFIFSFYLFLISVDSKEENKYIRYACIAATASILTKGLMILFFLPSCFIFLFVYKKQQALFTNKCFWIAMVVSIACILAWYLGREYVDPGYLQAVWTYEIGRYHTFVKPENPEWSYYWNMLVRVQLQYWLFGLFPAAYFLIRNASSAQSKFIYYILAQALAFLCIFSFSIVKLLWYDAPVLPLCAVIIGFGISETIKYISAVIPFSKTITVGVLFVLCFSFFYVQLFLRKFNRFYMESYGDFMFSKQTDIPYSIVYAEYNPHLLFYEQYAQTVLNQTHILKKSPTEFQQGENVLVCEPVLMINIKRKYEFEKLDSLGRSVFIQIKKSRN